LSVGAFRALFAVALMSCLSLLPGFGAFAQEGPDAGGAAAGAYGAGAEEGPGGMAPDGGAPAPDAHALAEQAIVLGEGAAAGAMGPAAASPLGIFRIVLTLAAVAGAIYGLVFLLKKVSRQGGGASQDPFLKVLATASIGASRALHVVSLGSQAWLVGSAEHGVSLISEVTDRETLDEMAMAESRKSAESPAGRLPDFKSMLRRLGMPADAAPPTPEDIRKRSERLKGM